MGLADSPLPGGVSVHHTVVNGKAAQYLCGGSGPAVVFLHGWGLASTPAYLDAVRQLPRNGFTVFAPVLPGFGSEKLNRRTYTLSDLADWVAQFVDAVSIPQPVALVGYSFGGGVAIRVAHRWPGLVERLVLINSIGGSVWQNRRGAQHPMHRRPLWDWGLHLAADFTVRRETTRVLPVILRDGLPPLLRHPGVLWRTAKLARTADLTGELDELKQRRLPVAIVWSREDRLIPSITMDSLRAAAGDHVFVTVDGTHSWVNSNPDAFCEVITNILTVDRDSTGSADDLADPR